LRPLRALRETILILVFCGLRQSLAKKKHNPEFAFTVCDEVACGYTENTDE
jgi:hypothetical protein